MVAPEWVGRLIVPRARNVADWLAEAKDRFVVDLVNVQLQQSTRTKVGSANAVHFVIAADVRRPGGGQ